MSPDGVVTSTQVGADEPLLAGHYPGFPIVPGVCLIECVHRSLLIRASRLGSSVELDVVESTRFLQPVFPGDRIVTEVRVDGAEELWRCIASVSTERGRAAEVRLRYRVLETATQ